MNLKDINLGELLYQHKNKVINIAIVILALLFSRNIYEHQLKMADSLREREQTEEKKNEVLKDIQQLEKKIEGYKSFVNKKDISLAMNIISEIAKDYSINVISIRPQSPQETDVYTKHFLELKLEAMRYHDIGKFISSLENRPELYCVESLKISPVYYQNPERRVLRLDLILSTIFLKD